MAVMRRTTALGDGGTYAVDEVLGLATNTIINLNEEVKRQGEEISKLRHELNAAYRSSAVAASRDIYQARREAEEAEARGMAAAASADTRRLDVEEALHDSYRKLENARRQEEELLRLVDRTAAAQRLTEERLGRARHAATRVLNALPPSAAEVAIEAEKLAKVASGETLVENEDIESLLDRALDRAMRLAERGQAAAAETAMVRAEAEAERAKEAKRAEEHRALLNELRGLSAECSELSLEAADAHKAREVAEDAVRRLQQMLGPGQKQLAALMPPPTGLPSVFLSSSPLAAPPARVTVTPESVRDSEAAAYAVVGLEAAVRDTQAMLTRSG